MTSLHPTHLSAADDLRDANAPRYQQLARALAELIRQGAFAVGARLPSVRQLAQQEQVSPITALSALRFLENEGLIEARPKSGYFVRAKPAQFLEPDTTTPLNAPTDVRLNQTIMRVIETSTRPNLIPLGAAFPNPDLFPVRRLRQLLAAQNRATFNAIGHYDMSMGHPELRQQITRRYAQYGTLLRNEEIVVTVGAMEALNLCLRAVTTQGDTVAVESPTYFGILQIIETLGLKALEIPTSSRDGISLEALEAATREPGRVKALLLMPTIQNPLGSIMPDSHKEAIVGLMAARQIAIIEDDIYGELCFDQYRPKPLKAWDKTGNVMLCSSFTKTIAPGFRVGWIACGRWLQEITHLKFTSSVSTASLFQIVLARFMDNGGYDHHLRHLKDAFRLQISRVSDAIERHFPPGTRLTRPRGGYLLWVELPERCNCVQLFEQALAEGIFVMPGILFATHGQYHHHLRINCGDLWSPQMEHALQRLGELCMRQLESQ